MPGGRKSKYFTHIQPVLEVIAGLSRRGITESEIAKHCGVAVSSFQLYKTQYPELSEALKNARLSADLKVENALFRKAVGYEYEEVTTEYVDNSRNGQNGKQKKVTKVKKLIPGDTTAQIFWLKNRAPELWNDRREIDAHVSDDLALKKFRATLDSMSLNEKVQLLRGMETASE